MKRIWVLDTFDREDGIFFSSEAKAKAYARWVRGPGASLDVEAIEIADLEPGETGAFVARICSAYSTECSVNWDHRATSAPKVEISGRRWSTNLYDWVVTAKAATREEAERLARVAARDQRMR